MLYTGFGELNAPADVLATFREIGFAFAGHGWTLRSGHKTPADMAFEDGAREANGHVEIHLPTKGHNGSTSNLYRTHGMVRELAQELVPGWRDLSHDSKRFHVSNVHEILGISLNHRKRWPAALL